ncbi:hypothetical protein JZ751_023919 [Albula glossodonta]|uniref:Uncharacterized protein n=1 Tax=Albula glossodonta TaxID=121402 RepID=A0A8T2NGV6_9TELE|nr:hypothetical protein JZ751_023919 [Albula glossodonta]
MSQLCSLCLNQIWLNCMGQLYVSFCVTLCNPLIWARRPPTPPTPPDSCLCWTFELSQLAQRSRNPVHVVRYRGNYLRTSENAPAPLSLPPTLPFLVLLTAEIFPLCASPGLQTPSAAQPGPALTLPPPNPPPKKTKPKAGWLPRAPNRGCYLQQLFPAIFPVTGSLTSQSRKLKSDSDPGLMELARSVAPPKNFGIWRHGVREEVPLG